jgi:hypothetical protein
MFSLLFLDVVPLEKHVYKTETQLAPMQVGHMWVSLYGTTKCPLWQFPFSLLFLFFFSFLRRAVA